MILSGLCIEEEVKRGRIIISPFNSKQINPNSYNLRLGSTIATYIMKREPYLNIINPPGLFKLDIDNSLGYIMDPGELYLATTEEVAGSNYYVPMIEGRSSVGRCGLTVHITAGFGDIGFIGQWTLEMTCVKPVRIYPGIEICQICFQEIKGDFELYKGRYQSQQGVVGSKGVS